MNRVWRGQSLVLGLVICGMGFAQTHPFSIHDMLAAQRLSDPQVSPDGKRILFVLRTTDLEADRGPKVSDSSSTFARYPPLKATILCHQYSTPKLKFSALSLR